MQTKIKAGKLATNHNQTPGGLEVLSKTKAGKLAVNHNQTS